MAEVKAMNNIEALNHGIEVMMEKDSNVVLYGEDAGFEGGVFRATQGLQKKFGESRVWDSPIAEAGIVGIGVGAAIFGIRPIVELQFQGFSYPAFQQIISHAARYRNRSRGRYHVPLVIRMPMGGDVRALEHHSEAVEAMFGHIPGIKVVLPSNPYDTKGLIISAIKSNDPVIFLEPKKLYRAFKQEIPIEEYEVEIGKANIIKQGKTLTVVSYGTQIHDCISAIKELEKTNPEIDVELIDLRTIKPIDTSTIIESVTKTGRILIVHEAVKTYSVSAEIIAQVNEKAFLNLLAPPMRLTAPDINVPLAQGEKLSVIKPPKIIKKIKQLSQYQY